jgi:hypothetical protein
MIPKNILQVIRRRNDSAQFATQLSIEIPNLESQLAQKRDNLNATRGAIQAFDLMLNDLGYDANGNKLPEPSNPPAAEPETAPTQPAVPAATDAPESTGT